MTVRITVTKNYDRWMAGFANLPREAAREGRSEWDAATREFFARTQAFVHVDTGALKASGDMRIGTQGSDLVGTVEYDAEYAIYENARGGSHAFMDRAWEQTEGRYAKGMNKVWDRVVTSWR